MESIRPNVLLVPGLSDSGPQHWQSLWHAQHREYLRVTQRDWERPSCAEWVETLDKYVTDVGGPVVLVGHSLGCVTIAYWAARYERRVHGALLVAPTDTEAPTYTFETEGFAPIPLKPFGFPSIVVASSNDPYSSLRRARQFAEVWGSRFVNIGAAGHINTDAGFGEWAEGEKQLAELVS